MLSTSGHERRRLQKAMVGLSGGGWLRGTRSEPPRRGGGAGARQSRVRRRAFNADAPSVGTTRGNPKERNQIKNKIKSSLKRTKILLNTCPVMTHV